MTGEAARQKAVAHVVFDMEDDLGDIERWALVLLDLGGCSEDPKGPGVYAVAEALHRSAEGLRKQWREAFALTHPKDEAPTCA